MNENISLYSISEIEKKYTNWYSEDSEIPREDQQWMWENLPLLQEDNQLSNTAISDDAYVNGDVYGGCKSPINPELIWYRSDAITSLSKTNSETTEIEKAKYLNEIFKYWPCTENYWLSVAQYYTSRVINWVLNETIKQSVRGNIKTNPAKYFTFVIKHRSKRNNNQTKNRTNL